MAGPTADDIVRLLDLKPHPEWDAKYAVFGRVVKGMEIVDKIQVADVLKKAYVKEGPAVP